MADIRPFCAIHPAPGLESRIAALPYDVYNRREAREEALKDPLSFLNIDRPETQFEPDHEMYADDVYEKAASMLAQAVERGDYVKDAVPSYYLYELTMDGRSQTGIVACASIDDYEKGIIKKHENTRAEKEKDRIRHVDACSAQTGPIFLAYRSISELKEIVEEVKKGAPSYDFTSSDGIRHRGWTISDADTTCRIKELFDKTDAIYIADGHHRAASAVRVGQERRRKSASFTGDEEFNYFLSVLFPDDELAIFDYNRVVKDLNGMSPSQFLDKVSQVCSITEAGGAVRPSGKGQVGLYLDGKWYQLSFNKELMNDDPVKGLDVSVLQDNILGPILGITDPRTDDRIDFVGGIRGLKELERRVSEDCAAAFSMYPTSIHELFAVADASLLMPPKSTWFEPKLRSGLYIHSL